MSQPAPANALVNPIEAVKAAVDFIKQLITICAQLTTFVSGGIYFLRGQAIYIAPVWFIALLLLLLSIIFGLLAFGAFIGQLDTSSLSTKRGTARFLALVQVLLFLPALICIIYGGIISSSMLK